MFFKILSLFAIIPTLLIGCSAGGGDESESTMGVSLSVTSLTLAPSESQTITATVTPDPTIGVVWESSDTKVAEIFLGTVTAVGVGEAVITITTDAGDTASCAVAVVAGDYQLVWSEEFDGETLDLDTWNIEINGNGCGNSEKQYYTDREENIRIEDGNLVIEARRENYDWAEYTSARITTSGKFDFSYGKIEARIDLPEGGGLWPAFWMMGYGSWPACGEIDILEYVGNNPGYMIHALHTYSASGMNGLNWSSNPAVDGIEEGYHTFGIEWEKCWWANRDVIRFYVDGQMTAEKYDPVTTEDNAQWPFIDEFYILLNLAVGGTLGGDIDTTIFDTERLMKVDYIRVYQRE